MQAVHFTWNDKNNINESTGNHNHLPINTDVLQNGCYMGFNHSNLLALIVVRPKAMKFTELKNVYTGGKLIHEV